MYMCFPCVCVLPVCVHLCAVLCVFLCVLPASFYQHCFTCVFVHLCVYLCVFACAILPMSLNLCIFPILIILYSVSHSPQIDKQLASGEYFLKPDEKRIKEQQRKSVGFNFIQQVLMLHCSSTNFVQTILAYSFFIYRFNFVVDM